MAIKPTRKIFLAVIAAAGLLSPIVFLSAPALAQKNEINRILAPSAGIGGVGIGRPRAGRAEGRQFAAEARQIAARYRATGAGSPPSEPIFLVPLEFEKAPSLLTERTEARLDRIAGVLHDRALARYRFQIGVHTVMAESDEADQLLTERAATAVKAYLVGGGVNLERIEAIGYGHAHPVNTADPASPDNRRIEVRLLFPPAEQVEDRTSRSKRRR